MPIDTNGTDGASGFTKDNTDSDEDVIMDDCF